MEIGQIVLGIGAVIGIIIVCVLAIVPTVMSIPLPGHPEHRPPLRPVDGTHRRGDPPEKPNHKGSVDLAA